ncbi:MAG: hypothetical protein ACLPUX_10160 [Syntrophobacteraceae bacterium]
MPASVKGFGLGPTGVAGEGPLSAFATVQFVSMNACSGRTPRVVEMVMPGDNISCEVKLITPVALEKELRFAIREGGRTVGAGVLTDIVK